MFPLAIANDVLWISVVPRVKTVIGLGIGFGGRVLTGSFDGCSVTFRWLRDVCGVLATEGRARVGTAHEAMLDQINVFSDVGHRII